MNLHREINFEQAICDHLAAHGWLYADGDGEHYDRAHGLFPPDLLAWVEATQPDSWERLAKNARRGSRRTLAERVRKHLNERGTLDVLRHGIEMLGLKRAADAGAVQAGAGDQPRHPGPLRRQPAARGAAGAVFAAQRELHRPGAVPQRHAGGDGRAEDRLHPERRRRGRPVPLRPPSAAQGPGRRAAAGVSQRGAGAFRGEQQRSA